MSKATFSASIEKKKLHLGPLPPQKDQYEIVEELQIRWDRILLSFALVSALVVALWWGWVIQGDDAPFTASAMPEEPPVLAAANVETAEMAAEPAAANPLAQTSETEQASLQSTVSVDEAASTATAAQATPLERRVSVPQPIEPEQSTQTQERLVKTINQLPAPAAIEPALREKESAVTEDAPAQVAVEILRQQVQHAELKAFGTDYHGGVQIALPDSGIVRVELHAQLEGLRGQVLHYEWWRDERRVAEIRVPVKQASQAAYSSKYINRAMTGDWQARIVDQQQQVLAQVRCVVR